MLNDYYLLYDLVETSVFCIKVRLSRGMGFFIKFEFDEKAGFAIICNFLLVLLPVFV